MKPSTLLVLLIGTSGCRATRSTQPHETGAANHDAAALRENRRAEEHARLAGPDTGQPGNCDRARLGPVCWTPEEHAREAERHREIADRHRAASAALRDAEMRACVEIDADNRDTSPFVHRRDIRSAEPIEASGSLIGATVIFRAVPGMTREWLQRQVDCHIARNAALGHARASEDMPYCPLTLARVRATVSSAGDDFAVVVTSDDLATAKVILRRAEALVDGSHGH